MKLDKIKFARLVGFAAAQGMTVDDWTVEKLDELIEVDIPEPAVMPSINPLDIDYLMALMAQGTRKIEAIKCHRKITGYGLKEAKDAVEKYWVSRPDEPIN